MNEVIFLIILFVFGAVFGSFACCQAWRLRLKEQREEEKKAQTDGGERHREGQRKQHEGVQTKEPGKRSICLSCGKRLSVGENIPILSWTLQRGKCKKCGAKIGWAEILSEIGLAVVFVIIGSCFYSALFGSAGSMGGTAAGDIVNTTSAAGAVSWLGGFPLGAALKLAFALMAVTAMWVVVVYDAKWGRMPNMGLLFANIFAAAYFVVVVIFDGVDWLGFVGAVGMLPALYYVLYIFSKEKWVGGGDWLLALAIALMLPNWLLALVALFVANFVASIAAIPMMIKEGKKAQVPFGPFLFVGFVVAFVAQDLIAFLMFL